MLRRALAAAAEQGVLISSNESSSLAATQTESSASHRDYGAIQIDDEHDEDDADDHYSMYEDTDGSLTTGGDGSYSMDDVNTISFVGKVYQKTSGFILMIANVDNLWDSPNPDQHAPIRRNKVVVLFWFFLLALAYAVERTTFKFLVDRAGPFRLFSVEMLTLCHAILLGLGMVMSALYRRKLSIKQPLGVPLVDVGCKSIGCPFSSSCLSFAFLTQVPLTSDGAT